MPLYADTYGRLLVLNGMLRGCCCDGHTESSSGSDSSGSSSSGPQHPVFELVSLSLEPNGNSWCAAAVRSEPPVGSRYAAATARDAADEVLSATVVEVDGPASSDHPCACSGTLPMSFSRITENGQGIWVAEYTTDAGGCYGGTRLTHTLYIQLEPQ
jgi:hypothetical protein